MKKYLTLNLEEQVQKNASDIQAIIDGNVVLGELGIRVVGQVDTETELPDPATYLGAYGDAYLVGAETPYNYYIFTRPFVGEDTPQWFNIGQFPVPGPQGERGPAGEVKKGDRGSVWYVGQTLPSQFSPAAGDYFREQDMYLNSTTGIIYQYANNTWQPKGNIIGPQGITGQPGQRGSKWYSGTTSPGQAGLSGVQAGDMYLETDNGNIYQTAGGGWVRISNIRGPQGEQGKNATAVTIVAELPSADQLPTPTAAIRNNAYLVDINGVYHLYVITQTSTTDTTLIWTDMGPHGGSQIYANGQPVDIWDADTKLDKITSNNDYARLYAVSDRGAQTTFNLASPPTAYTVAYRTSTGTLKGATPTADNDLTTKAYVDNAVANAGGGGSAPTVHTMSIKVSSAWLVDKVIGYSVKEGNGPPISQPSVAPLPEMGMFSLNGAWSSAGYSKLFGAASFDYPESAMTYNLSLDVVAPNNVAGLSTSDDRVLCRSYFTFNSIVEKNEYGVIYDATLYFYA